MLNNAAEQTHPDRTSAFMRAQASKAGDKKSVKDEKMTQDSKKSSSLKHSYTIACSSLFRDRVTALAESKKVNVADLARSVLLMVPLSEIENFEDPGEPDSDDRETVILKSGPSKGRPWRRKPRLQVRMAPGFDVVHIRKALNLALSMEEGAAEINIDTPEAKAAREREVEQLRKAAQEASARAASNHNLPETMEEIERLQAMVSVLSFEPLRHGVQDRSDALHIMGFAPRSYPDKSELRARFRMLATIHHPDGKYGSHERMSQLNQAMAILRPAS